MTFPRHIQAALTEIDRTDLPGRLSDEGLCAGAKFHSPSPLLLREESVAGQIILLCGTCFDNLGVLRRLLENSDGMLPWKVRREFGNQIREIALREWPNVSVDGASSGV